MKKINPFLQHLLIIAFILGSIPAFANPCSSPNKLKAYNPTAFSIRLQWDAGGGLETLNYRPVSSSSWETIRNVKSPFILPGLDAATTYEYYISTDCPNARTEPLKSRFTTLESCNPAINVTTSNIKINSAQLTWTRGTGINSEVIALKEVGTSNEIHITTPYGAPTYKLTELKRNSEYEVVIMSNCAISSEPTNNTAWVMSFPYRFKTGNTASCGDVDLYIKQGGYYALCAIWYPESGTITGYELCYRDINKNDPAVCKTLPKTQTVFNIPGKPNTTYEIELKTTCSDGTVYSQKDTAKTIELPKCALSATFGTITTNSISIGIAGDLANFRYISVFYKKQSDAQYSVANFPSQNMIVLTGLSSSTYYDIYVAASCDGAEASFTTTYSFKTKGLPCPMPTNLRIANPSTTVTPFCQVPDCIGIDWDYSFTATNPNFTVTIELFEQVGAMWVSRSKINGVPLDVRFFPFGRFQYQSLAVGRNYRFSVTVDCEPNNTSSASYSFSITPTPAPLVRASNPALYEAEVKKLKEQLHVDEILFAPIATSKDKPINNVLTVSPNPTSEGLMVYLPNENFEQLSVYSIDGRLVKQVAIKGTGLSYNFNCTDLKNGMYLMVVKSKEEALNTRFVKQ